MLNQHLIKRKTERSLTSSSSVWLGMKLVLAICLGLTLLISCGGEPNLENPKVRDKILAEAIDVINLEYRSTPEGKENVAYAPNQKQPYTGWVKGEGVQAAGVNELFLVQLQRGISNGLFIAWYSNGQKSWKGAFKNSRKVGVWTRWYQNGQKKIEGTYKIQGSKKDSGSYKVFDFVALYFDEGDREGKWVGWHENGQKSQEGIYKSGERVGKWVGWQKNGQKMGEVTYESE